MTSTGDIPGIPSHRSRKCEEGMGALQKKKKKESGKSKGSLPVSMQEKSLKITPHGCRYDYFVHSSAKSWMGGERSLENKE